MTADRTTRDQLAAALHGRQGGARYQWDEVADALLPVVERIAAERAAAELWEVADHVRNQHPGYVGRIDSADSIDARATDLRAAIDALDAT